MRTKLSVHHEGATYVVRLTEHQRSAVSSALLFMRDRSGSEALALQLGCSREFLGEIYRRVDENQQNGWSIEALHVIHAALSSIGNLFASEEDFYIRLGFFRENSAAMAVSLVDAITACRVE